MGLLLDHQNGVARLEVRGVASAIRAEGGAAFGDRIGLHASNSPELVHRIVGALDRGAIPVLAHPRWPDGLATDALRRAGAGSPWPGDAIATLLFTSGSTAAPKIVAHTLEAHLAAAHASGERVPFGAEHRWLLSLPLCHVGGLSLLFRTVVGGATLVLPEPDEKLGPAIIRTRPSHVSLVATQLRDLMSDGLATAALAACEAVLLGGGPCPPELVARAHDAGIPIRRTYGMTEMGSQIATESAGRVLSLPGVELKVDAGDQLWVRGPSLFRGYLRDDVIERPFVDGWFATGDLGRLDPEGGLTILGRRDHQFISGGENVQPEAVEAALAKHGIEVLVVPVPDERYGARPVAFTRGGVSHASLAERELPSFARPIAWLELPDTGGLKPRRAELSLLADRLLSGTEPQ